MAAGDRWNLPNLITVVRIATCPVIYWLALAPGVTERLLAFVLFLAASASDLWDGYLARKHGLITNMGKLLDPVADKLLLVATFIPVYLISHRGPASELPWWGALPLWVLAVIFGRELAITVFRSWAARRGEVIPAGRSGKYKAFIQNLFLGGALLWYPLLGMAQRRGWGGSFWQGWQVFHGAWIGLMLAAALILTVYSMVDYLWGYRRLLSGSAGG
ncbi:MAG: CDP-diacylglycerol--glycerol-3-phosphate 3-phosphatidyltransferase [Gemmatimonadota bacterium]|nr:CDP-diacylglycerol--glycerol-3-phosphate 3-phosphatidyltransferase [Gemmatimonadota bacterium]